MMNEKENIPLKKPDASWFPTFRRIWDSLLHRRGIVLKGFELGNEEYKPGINYRLLGKNWQGPVYLIARNHRLDLQYVIGQIRGLVRSNVPLVSGIEAVAREEQRFSFGKDMLYAVIMAFWLTVLFLAVIVIALAGFGWGKSEDSLMLTFAFIVAFILLGWVFYNWLSGNKRAALLILVILVLGIAAFAASAYVQDWRWFNRRLILLYDTPSGVVVFVGMVTMAVVCFYMNYRAARKNGSREMVLVRTRDLLSGGLDLSAAMRRLPRFFPQFYADMVEAGEQTGRMDACLAELCADTQTDLKVQRQIRGTVLYLGIVGLVMLVIMTFLMIKVVPVFFEIEKEFGTKSHVPFISGVIALTDTITSPGGGPIHRSPSTQKPGQQKLATRAGLAAQHISIPAITPLVIIVGVITFFLWRLYRKRRRGFSSRPLSSLFLLLPGFRGMVMQDNFTVITGTLEKLLCAGVPLDRAVEKASAGDVNPVYSRMLRRVHKRILEGESLVAAFQQASGGLLVPASFTSLVAVGEQSGMLPEALAYLHTFYRTQADIRARILVDTIKPFGVMLMGLVVMLFLRDTFTLLVGLTESVLAWM
jgi:type II secretory pathway component PulF